MAILQTTVDPLQGSWLGRQDGKLIIQDAAAVVVGVRTECGVVCHYVTEVQALGQRCRIIIGYKALSMTNTWCASRPARQEAPFHALSVTGYITVLHILGAAANHISKYVV